MIEGKYLYGSHSDLSEVFDIRRQVYVEEFGIDKNIEFDGYDKMSIHALISVKGKKLGAGRLIYDGDEYRIGHIAILKEERGKGYGDFLVRMLIDKAFLSGAKEIYVDAKIEAVEFYKKIGFFIADEVTYKRDGFQRIKMGLTKESLCKECQK